MCLASARELYDRKSKELKEKIQELEKESKTWHDECVRLQNIVAENVGKFDIETFVFELQEYNCLEWRKIIRQFRENKTLKRIQIIADSAEKEELISINLDYIKGRETEEWVEYTRLHENYNLVIQVIIYK